MQLNGLLDRRYVRGVMDACLNGFKDEERYRLNEKPSKDRIVQKWLLILTQASVRIPKQFVLSIRMQILNRSMFEDLKYIHEAPTTTPVTPSLTVRLTKLLSIP